jgi:hypothetical protein
VFRQPTIYVWQLFLPSLLSFSLHLSSISIYLHMSYFFFYPSVLFIYLPILSIYLSVYVFLSICLIYLPIDRSINVCIFIFFRSIPLSQSQIICMIKIICFPVEPLIRLIGNCEPRNKNNF